VNKEKKKRNELSVFADGRVSERRGRTDDQRAFMPCMRQKVERKIGIFCGILDWGSLKKARGCGVDRVF